MTLFGAVLSFMETPNSPDCLSMRISHLFRRLRPNRKSSRPNRKPQVGRWLISPCPDHGSASNHGASSCSSGGYAPSSRWMSSCVSCEWSISSNRSRCVPRQGGLLKQNRAPQERFDKIDPIECRRHLEKHTRIRNASGSDRRAARQSSILSPMPGMPLSLAAGGFVYRMSVP